MRNDSRRPSVFPLSHGALLRGVPGDARRIGAGQSAQLIDVEYAVPQPLLIVLQSTNADTGAVIGGRTTVRTGIERASFDSETTLDTAVMRAVLARSVQVTFENTNGGIALLVKCIIVPLDITADASIFGSSSFGVDPIVDPADGSPLALVNVFPIQNFAGSVGLLFKRALFQNISPLGFNTYVRLGAGNATPLVWSVLIPPGGYWESPAEFSGEATYICDGNDGSANAGLRVTTIVS